MRSLGAEASLSSVKRSSAPGGRGLCEPRVVPLTGVSPGPEVAPGASVLLGLPSLPPTSWAPRPWALVCTQSVSAGNAFDAGSQEGRIPGLLVCFGNTLKMLNIYKAKCSASSPGVFTGRVCFLAWED